jgi:glycosyltransferase involved in cell wall biosynthesis
MTRETSSSFVIAHDNSFNGEVLGDFGMFFQTSDDLALNICAIENRQVQKDVLLRGAIDRIRTHYLWDQIAESYSELLHSDQQD